MARPAHLSDQTPPRSASEGEACVAVGWPALDDAEAGTGTLLLQVVAQLGRQHALGQLAFELLDQARLAQQARAILAIKLAQNLIE